MTLEIVTSNAKPPDGVVTLELRSAATGRLRKRVTQENALMDWYKNTITRGDRRGDLTNTYPGINSESWEWQGMDPLRFLARDNSTLREARWLGLGGGRTGWFPDNSTNTSAGWLWGTDQNIAVDSTQMEIPVGGASANGEVTGGAYLADPWTLDGIQNKRGTIDAAASSWTWAQQRIVCTFGASIGNGVWRSVGLGGLQPQRIAPGGLRACRLATLVQSGAPNSFQWYRPWTLRIQGRRFAPGRPGSNSMYVVSDSGASIAWWDLTDDSTPSISFNGTATAPAGTGISAVVDTASDFWVLRDGILSRCDTRPPVALNVVNTYDLSASFTGNSLYYAMTFDGTDLRIMDETTVHTVSTTTGAITGSFAHGLSNAATLKKYEMAWNPATSELYLCLTNGDNTSASEGWGFATASGQFNWNGTGDDTCIHRFTSAGSKTGTLMGTHETPYTDQQDVNNQISFFTDDGVFSGSCHEIDSSLHELGIHAPSMASHALLGADLTKTAAEILTVTYDFNYA